MQIVQTIMDHFLVNVMLDTVEMVLIVKVWYLYFVGWVLCRLRCMWANDRLNNIAKIIVKNLNL